MMPRLRILVVPVTDSYIFSTLLSFFDVSALCVGIDESKTDESTSLAASGNDSKRCGDADVAGSVDFAAERRARFGRAFVGEAEGPMGLFPFCCLWCFVAVVSDSLLFCNLLVSELFCNCMDCDCMVCDFLSHVAGVNFCVRCFFSRIDCKMLKASR
jgi:hypothetical protein